MSIERKLVNAVFEAEVHSQLSLFPATNNSRYRIEYSDIMSKLRYDIPSYINAAYIARAKNRKLQSSLVGEVIDPSKVSIEAKDGCTVKMTYRLSGVRHEDILNSVVSAVNKAKINQVQTYKKFSLYEQEAQYICSIAIVDRTIVVSCNPEIENKLFQKEGGQ